MPPDEQSTNRRRRRPMRAEFHRVVEGPATFTPYRWRKCARKRAARRQPRRVPRRSPRPEIACAPRSPPYSSSRRWTAATENCAAGNRAPCARSSTRKPTSRARSAASTNAFLTCSSPSASSACTGASHRPRAGPTAPRRPRRAVLGRAASVKGTGPARRKHGLVDATRPDSANCMPGTQPMSSINSTIGRSASACASLQMQACR